MMGEKYNPARRALYKSQDRVARLTARLIRVREQRDELLAACEAYHAALSLEDYLTEEMLSAMATGRAAIARVTDAEQETQ